MNEKACSSGHVFRGERCDRCGGEDINNLNNNKIMNENENEVVATPEVAEEVVETSTESAPAENVEKKPEEEKVEGGESTESAPEVADAPAEETPATE